MPPWEILLECEILTLEGSGGLVPGWSRKCPLGVPLIVHILTLAGPGPFLCADVGVGRGGSDFRNLMFILSYYLLISIQNHQKLGVSDHQFEFGTSPSMVSTD